MYALPNGVAVAVAVDACIAQYTMYNACLKCFSNELIPNAQFNWIAILLAKGENTEVSLILHHKCTHTHIAHFNLRVLIGTQSVEVLIK